MNASTGEVRDLRSFTEEEKSSPTFHTEWREFTKGEIITLKGINFRVHEIGTGRIVLKFVNPQKVNLPK